MTQFDPKQIINEKLQAEIAERKLIEQTLREQANLLDLTHDTIFVRDLNYVITYWNRGAEELYGWKREEAVGKVAHLLMQTILPEPLEEIMAKLVRTCRWEGELVHTKRDGTKVVVASRWSLQNDAHGYPIAILETNNDITERKRAEEALQRSVKELENSNFLLGATLESTAGGILVTNTEGKIVRFNRKFLDLWNIPYSNVELLERSPVPEFILDQLKNPEAFLEKINELRSQPEADSFDVLEFEDGRIYERYSEPQRIRETIIGRVWSFRDITERKRAEEELRQSEAYLTESQKLTHTGSWAYNAGGIVYWSEEMFRIFAFDPQEGYPSPDEFFERIHPEDRDWLRERVHAVLDEKIDHSHDHRIVLPDGSVKHIHVIGHPVLNDAGDVVEVVGTLVDITERKRTQEALQVAQAQLEHITRVATLGEMISSIAHEINQPLAAVVNNASACLRWLKAQNLDEARQCVSLVIADGHRASEIIGRIRALIRKAPPEKCWIDINETIKEVITLMQSEVQRNHVSLQTQLSGDLPLILGDRIQLQQVILNLMMNAIEAMSAVNEGSRRMWVSSERVESSDIVIAVRDLGPGLDPKSLDHLFDAFYTTKSQGMGMGLAISRSIIEAHGGRLWATANIPHGAVFQFTLPIGSSLVTEG